MNNTFPKERDQYKHQTKLSSISDEAFVDGYTAKPFTWLDRVLQVISFFLFLGPLRLLLMILITIVYAIIMIPVIVFTYNKSFIGRVVDFYIWVSQIYIRLLAGCLSIVRVKIEGDIDRSARNFIFNHLTPFDGPLLFSLIKFTVVTAIGATQMPVFGRILIASDCIPIDRSKSGNNAELIAECIKDKTRRPVAMSAEGKITNGDYLIKFRTGGFLVPTTIQPVALRYTNYLALGGATTNWLVDSIVEYLWLCLCCPFTTLTMTFLPPFHEDDWSGKTPRDIAQECQLRIANHLGTLAIDRDNKSIFQKKEE